MTAGRVGNGTALAELNCRRLSAIAASKHWRSAKTAFRVVAAERPLANRSETHCRTPPLVIARSGALPKRGRTCFCIVVSSRAQVVARRSCRVGSHCSTHSCRRISPRRGSCQVPSGQRNFDFGLTTLGVDESHLGFAMLSRQAAECDGAQCGPCGYSSEDRRRSACRSSQASTVERR